ncbi:MAG: zinc ABC transporter substrate-binding protein [Alphaproteobacteria bacterium]|nr:zinc ABC transporter substrate-binding protein [Alphaproteobacteria bacterium]
MRRLSILLLAALLWAAPARAGEPLRVVASFSVLADLVGEVGGEHVAVDSLVPMGGAPHDWEPRPYDVAALAEADLVVVNGLGLEGWLDRLIAASGHAGPVLMASRGVEPLLDASGAPDPHAWHSLAATRLYARAIAGALTELRPARADAFRANLDAFLAELDKLDAWARGALAAIPPERRVVVTSHDAFAWLGRDFGIRILSPTGLDSTAQPSAKRLGELVAEIRATGVRAVFLEAGGDPRLARTLAEEAGVAVGAALYAGTLTPACDAAANYLSMWRYNFVEMLKAMGR